MTQNGIARHNVLFLTVRMDHHVHPKPFRQWLKDSRLEELKLLDAAKPCPIVPSSFLPLTTEIFGMLLPQADDTWGDDEEDDQHSSEEDPDVTIPYR